MGFIKTCKVGGTDFSLAFSAYAMMEIDKITGDGDLIDIISSEATEDYSKFCRIVEEMGKAGELYRRFEGEDRKKILGAEEIERLILPYELPELKRAMLQAVAAGYKREEDDGEEVDLGLAELQKKTKFPEQ